MCLLAAISFLDVSIGNAQSAPQPGSATPAAAPAKPAKLDTRVEREERERSEREKREELGKKLERRRNELNSVPSNNLMPNNSRPVRSEDADRKNSEDSKPKERK